MNFDDFIQNQGAVTIPNPNYNPRSKKNKGPRTLDIIDLSADRNNLRDVVKKDLETGVRADYDDIKKYERYGVSWNPKDAANGSLDVQLAEAQSNWTKLGNALAQTVVSEIGLGTALGISDLFDAIGQAVGASDHNYNNPVSAKLEEWQDKFNNEVAPIYSRPGAGFGNGTDFGWWMQNIPSIASSLTLLIPAAGGTKLLSMAGKAALKTTKAGAKWLERATRLDRIHKAGHNVGISSKAYETGKLFAKNATTAALSRTMENYQEARQVYNDMYVDVLDSLNKMDDEEYNAFLNRNQNTVRDVDTSNKDEVAKAVAKQSSDLTFKADYANTVFDIIELYALRNVAFHGFRNSKVSAASRRLDKNARRFAGQYKTIAELEELISKQSFGTKAADKIGDILYAGRTVGLAQASEGIEEAINYIAQQEGMEVGKSMLSMEANTIFSNRLKQYVKNPELWESAFWGVVGGIVFQGAGSGLARAKTALERKNESKKNQSNEKTGEDVNANTSWKALWELPDVKRVKASIENRLAIENKYQENVKQILDNNEMAEEEKDIMIQALRERRRTDLALNAMDSGTIDMLKGYLEDNNVKQALIDKGVISKEQADNIQAEDIEAIQKVQDRYDDNVRKLNAVSRNINAKNGINIPTEYLQIIARNNIEAQLTVENLQRQLASWTDDAVDLQHNLEENNKIDNNINYKEAIRLRWLSEKLGQLEADKKEILDNKKLAKSISGQERIREINDNIDVIKNQVEKLNPENKIENLLFAIQTSLGYEKFNGEYLETGRRKEYVNFTNALIAKDAKYFEKLDDKLVGIEERIFGAKEVLDQNMARALAKSETNISNISKELGEAYATLASLEYMIDAQRNNIKLGQEEVEQEVKYIHNYMNEVRKQKIANSTEVIKGLADRYGSDNIRNLITQRYNNETLDYSNINVSDEDKNLLNEALDTFNLSDKLNSDLAKSIDVILSTYDDVKAAKAANIKSKTIESSSTIQNEDLGTQNQNRDNLSTEAQESKIEANPAQMEANGVQTNSQQSKLQTNTSGLTDIRDGVFISTVNDGTYRITSTSNPNQFEVSFPVQSNNVKHFNNPNLFVQQEGVDLTADNYIIVRQPIVDSQGNVTEKGVLGLTTEDNVTQAEINTEEDNQNRNESLASTGEVYEPRTPSILLEQAPDVLPAQVQRKVEINNEPQLVAEQLYTNPEEKNIEDTSKAAEIPYVKDDVRSLASVDMMLELGTAIKEGKDIDWNGFRQRLNAKYQTNGNTSQEISKDIESVIRAGKAKAERRGVKSFDAVVDVMTKSSRLKENVSNVENEKDFSDSVQQLINVFDSEVGIDTVNDKKYINVEALCRYCDKVLNDKLSAKLLLNNLLKVIDKNKKYVITDSNKDNIQEKLRKNINNFNTSKQQLGIDYTNTLRQAETSRNDAVRESFYEVADNIQPGNKLDIEREEGGLIFKSNGVKLGSLPYPKVAKDGTLYQDNDNWNTDIKIIQGGNIQSKLQDLFVKWATDVTNPDIKELNDIILQYLDLDYEGDKSELVKQFKENKEVKKAVANKLTVDNPNYEKLLKGISKVWQYTRANGGNFDGSILEARQFDIKQWFKERVAPSYVFIQKIKENPNLEVEVNTITEGAPIITTREKALPISKAIGTNYKDKVKLGVAQQDGIITIAGNGIDGSNMYSWRANKGSTFVIIPARNGEHALIHAFPQKVSSTSISKTAKDIKQAIYSEINRICNDETVPPQDKAKTLETFLRQVLPVYNRNTTKTEDTSSFFRRNIEDTAQINIGDNFYKGSRYGYTVRINNVYYNILPNGVVRQGNNTLSLEDIVKPIIDGIEKHCVFNISYSAINSDLGHAERQYLTKRGTNGEYIVSIPNQGDFSFDSYNDFVLKNDLVLATTEPTPDGRSNFNRISDNYRANQQLYVKISNDTTSPVEESVEESTTTPTVANPRETEILDILNSKRIKNKAEKLADLLFGKKVRKSLSFGKKEYKLFPKNIIFVDRNIEDNALVNTSDRPLLHEDTQILMPAKTVVLGKEWLEMATNDNVEERKQAAKKLIHEQLHILLSGENSKYVEQIREVFDEFAEKNTNEELNKYLYKWDEARYYTDGKLNKEGLEEFLVETLTSNELANALNNIETTSTEDKTKKESLFQKIMKLLAKILGIDIKQGSLYEKEFKLLRDILSTSEDVTSTVETETEETTEKASEEFLGFLQSDAADVLNDDDMDIFGSRIKEEISTYYTPEMESIKTKAIADDTFMKAPNGNPTNLNERQWLQVRTKAFKDWFGDWENDAANASKVVDKNGEPLVVYHGSKDNSFVIFDRTKNDKGQKGFFFTNSEVMASSYGKNPRAFFLNAKDPYIIEGNGHNWDDISITTSTISKDKLDSIRLYKNQLQLQVQNGTISKDVYDFWNNKYFKRLDYYNSLGNSVIDKIKKRIILRQLETFKAEGDFVKSTRYTENILELDTDDVSMIFNNITDYGPVFNAKAAYGSIYNIPANVYVVTNPNQIKSATDNVGTFSKTDDNIKHSRIRENTVPSISSYVSTFPLSEQPEIIDKIENGEISVSCK